MVFVCGVLGFSGQAAELLGKKFSSSSIGSVIMVSLCDKVQPFGTKLAATYHTSDGTGWGVLLLFFGGLAGRRRNGERKKERKEKEAMPSSQKDESGCWL